MTQEKIIIKTTFLLRKRSLEYIYIQVRTTYYHTIILFIIIVYYVLIGLTVFALLLLYRYRCKYEEPRASILFGHLYEGFTPLRGLGDFSKDYELLILNFMILPYHFFGTIALNIYIKLQYTSLHDLHLFFGRAKFPAVNLRCTVPRCCNA